MEARISNDEFPIVGIRGAICDLHARDKLGDNLQMGFQVSQDCGGANLDIYFVTEGNTPRVKVACCLIDGRLSVDVIDYAKLGPDDIPCGAEAVATATITVNPEMALCT